jgi:hypothetical protein
LALQFALFAAGGASVLALPLVDLHRRRDADSLLLALWIWGTFLFAAVFNWSINGRSILPMVPAVGIVLMRAIESRPWPRWARRWHVAAWPLLPAAVLSLVVCWTDARWANTARLAADDIHERYAHEWDNLWFQGHWGFQYYMQQYGARPLDRERSELEPDQLMVIPRNNTNTHPLEPDRYWVIATRQWDACRWLSTMNHAVGAGFYADAVGGPLPFAFGPVPPERCEVVRLR